MLDIFAFTRTQTLNPETFLGYCASKSKGPQSLLSDARGGGGGWGAACLESALAAPASDLVGHFQAYHVKPCFETSQEALDGLRLHTLNKQTSSAPK